MKATYSCKTSILTKPTKPHVSDYSTLHSHRRENLKEYIRSNFRFTKENKKSREELIANFPSTTTSVLAETETLIIYELCRRGYSISITDMEDVWSTLLGWLRAARYTYQVCRRLLQAFQQY
jgi:hypothetical protein